MQSRKTKIVVLTLLLTALLIGMIIILRSSTLPSILKVIAGLDIAGFFMRFFGIKTINLETLKDIFSQLIIFYIGVIATVVIIRLIQLRHGPARLIIEEFRNASDSKFTPDEMMNFSLEARKLLVEKIGRINHRIREHSSGDGPETYRAPLPSTHVLDAEQRLENITDTFEKDVPRSVAWVMPFINLLMPSRSTKVACSLQQLVSDGCPAFTFEIVDTSGKTKPDIYTIEHKARGRSLKACYSSTVPTGRAFNPMLVPRETHQERRTQTALDAYSALLPTAINALAIEICKREMLAHIPFNRKILHRQNHYKAQVYNFFGSLYAAYARADDGFYYKRAIHNFEQAILFDRAWPLPYANLADLHSVKGQQTSGQEAIDLQYTARDEYHQALQYINSSLKWKIKKSFWMIKEAIHNSGKSTTKQSPGREKDLRLTLADKKERGILARMIIGEARVHLLIDGAECINIANNNIQQTEKAINETELSDPRVLYYLACWYALAYNLARKDEAWAQVAEKYQNKAHLYIAYCLARNSEEIFDKNTIENKDDLDDLDWYYWKRAETDQDLESIKPFLKDLKQELKKQHNQILTKHKSDNTSLSKLNNRNFKRVIGKVVRDSWRLHQKRLMLTLDNLPPLDDNIPKKARLEKGARGDKHSPVHI